MSEDRELFSDTMLEGEYTTWTRLWTRDFGGVWHLLGITVDNLGNVYACEDTSNISWVITRANVLTTLTDYRVQNYTSRSIVADWYAISRGYSATGKYMLALKATVPYAISVWRDGVLIREIFYQTGWADGGYLAAISISPNGRYIAAIFRSVASGAERYVNLYEGS